METANIALAKREVQLEKIECEWCWRPAAWKITDPFSIDYACTAHGTEWFPELFPESDTAPIECIVRDACSPVGTVQDVQRPWYPLVGHREGLRANDLVSLASALFILALEGGTAHGPWAK